MKSICDGYGMEERDVRRSAEGYGLADKAFEGLEEVKEILYAPLVRLYHLSKSMVRGDMGLNGRRRTGKPAAGP